MNEFSQLTDEQLYHHIIDLNPDDLLAKHNLGLEKFKLDPLVAEVRRRCETNLWFLGKYFLWDTDVFGEGLPIEQNIITEHIHRRVFDMFIVKDKRRSLGAQDPDCKDRLILYPRGTQKSSIDRYDVVQWILNFPQIRILYLTATSPLAEGFVNETKGHFLVRESKPSLMNLFFPEYCFSENDSGPTDKLVCPLLRNKNRREPTVWAAGVETNMSGFHFEIIKADDCVSDENTTNYERCKKVTAKFNLKHKMRIPSGYTDKVGTRYSEDDMYGEDEARVGENPEKFRVASDTNWDILYNPDVGLKILIGRDIVIKPEVKEQLERDGKPVTYVEAGKAGCTLLCPEIHSYEWCLYEYNKSPIIFEGQQNQNPRESVQTDFDLPLLLRHTVPRTDKIIPITGPVSQFWDFAWSEKKGRDYSTGTACIWSPSGKCIVVDMIKEKFNPTQLPRKVVEFAVKYRPYVVGIEKSAGSELYDQIIRHEALATKIPEVINVLHKIDWVTPTKELDAKRTRMRELHPWLTRDMLYFVNDMPHLQDLYDQFQRCLQHKRSHNDIPDSLAYQLRYAPAMSSAIQRQETERFSRPDGAWSYLFDTSGQLYGEGEYNQSGPFQGLILRQDVDDQGNINLHWVSQSLPNPILVAPTVEEGPPPRDENSLDPILGIL